MKEPQPIETSTWARREHFEYYLDVVPCTYSVTVDLDVTPFVTAVRRSRRKTYPAQVWALSTVINRHEEFRMCLTKDGAPAVWPLVHPAFTVFNPERETFAVVWARHEPDFATFHERAAQLLAEHRHSPRMFPQGPLPDDVFDVSSMPWFSFTAFDLSIRDSWRHLAPVFTLGRYREHGEQIMLPLAIQIHHAVADGFHTSRLVDDLQSLLSEPTWLV